MTNEEILSKTDHTLLKQDSTWEQIRGIIDDGIKYKTASVCIPPYYVKQASEYAKGRVAICTVIGFPEGYSTKESKCFEASDAVKNGADEIGMVAMEQLHNQYLGGDASLTCSPETQTKIDKMTVDLVKAQHDKAFKLLQDNINKLHEITKFLYEKETITGAEFMEILNRKEIDPSVIAPSQESQM